MLTILDLCAGTGAWSEPYVRAGYNVVRVDLPEDVRLISWEPGVVHGILAAPPCTVFSYARNRYPPTESEILGALSVVDACLRAVAIYHPRWWALENPLNKLRRWLGPPRLMFRQNEYGGVAVKPTGIWGDFVVPQRNVVSATKLSTYKTSRENARPEDAITPAGFAQAFFDANR